MVVRRNYLISVSPILVLSSTPNKFLRSITVTQHPRMIPELLSRGHEYSRRKRDMIHQQLLKLHDCCNANYLVIIRSLISQQADADNYLLKKRRETHTPGAVHTTHNSACSKCRERQVQVWIGAAAHHMSFPNFHHC